MNQFKRSQVIMLPTENRPCLLNLTLSNKLHLWNTNGTTYNPNGQHLYIISDDEIKEYDWFLNTKTNAIGQHNGSNILLFKEDKKIIATTDTSLKINSELSNSNSIKFQLPQPSQQFITKYIEEYNKGNIITDVLVELLSEEGYGCDLAYYGLTEQEIKINPKDNTITIKKLKDSFNLEEMYKLMDDYQDYLFKTNDPVKTFKEWFNLQ